MLYVDDFGKGFPFAVFFPLDVVFAVLLFSLHEVDHEVFSAVYLKVVCHDLFARDKIVGFQFLQTLLCLFPRHEKF
ncbi:hypothetical protein AZI98_16245 [Aeribacillus pallidus]|uniref:Uncharacterized protein n=1 Tax=Aeribacillus pallidus TaxID=33936 RepID=A0A165WIX2_9BACI|nr:hypothetical protein AZI98_16245 [Aeribacillus pallidus]